MSRPEVIVIPLLIDSFLQVASLVADSPTPVIAIVVVTRIVTIDIYNINMNNKIKTVPRHIYCHDMLTTPNMLTTFWSSGSATCSVPSHMFTNTMHCNKGYLQKGHNIDYSLLSNIDS